MSTPRRRLGPWLWLLIIQSMLGALFTAIALWSSRAAWLGQGNVTQLAIWGSLCGANLAVGLLLALRRTAGSLQAVLAINWILLTIIVTMLLWPGGLVDVVTSLQSLGPSSPFWLAVIALLVGKLVLLLECLRLIAITAYLLTAPRLTALYPGALTSRPAQPQFQDLPRRLLMILLALAGLLPGVVDLMMWHITAPGAGADTLAGRMLPDTPTVALHLVLAGSGVLAAILLWRGRSWSALKAVLACLWLWPVSLILYRLTGTLGWSRNAAFLVNLSTILIGGSIALYWTAYLLEAPAIGRRFHGRPSGPDQVTDVDVF
jgi:hypothetical protein